MNSLPVSVVPFQFCYIEAGHVCGEQVSDEVHTITAPHQTEATDRLEHRRRSATGLAADVTVLIYQHSPDGHSLTQPVMELE